MYLRKQSKWKINDLAIKREYLEGSLAKKLVYKV